MNPEQVEIAEEVINFFKKSDKVIIVPGIDLLHILPNNISAQKVIYPLEKDYKLIEKASKYGYRLTDKGWKF